MTIGDKAVTLSEFMYVAKKNGNLDITDSQTLKDYVEMFTNYKLKVLDAETQGIDKSAAFRAEFHQYKQQLISSHLNDPKEEETYAQKIYNQGNEVYQIGQLLFRMKSQNLPADTLAAWNHAMEVRRMLIEETSMDSLGLKMAIESQGAVNYIERFNYVPTKSHKHFEEIVYQMKEGDLSMPILTNEGYYLVKLYKKFPNPGKAQVSQILFKVPTVSTVEFYKKQQELANKVYEEAKAGIDFATLAKTYSEDDESRSQNGLMPMFEAGNDLWPVENAGFTLEKEGDISEVCESYEGFHIVKLEKRAPRSSFEEVKPSLIRYLNEREYRFEMYAQRDERLKKEGDFKEYPEVYAELEKLSDKYFPSNLPFFNATKEIANPLFTIEGKAYSPHDFADYIQRYKNLSRRTYSGHYLKEMYMIYVQDMLLERALRELTQQEPEIAYLLNEYKEGILLFEVSNKEVWSKPMAEQEALEAAWVKQLHEKYPVDINWRLLESKTKK